MRFFDFESFLAGIAVGLVFGLRHLVRGFRNRKRRGFLSRLSALLTRFVSGLFLMAGLLYLLSGAVFGSAPAADDAEDDEE